MQHLFYSEWTVYMYSESRSHEFDWSYINMQLFFRPIAMKGIFSIEPCTKLTPKQRNAILHKE